MDIPENFTTVIDKTLFTVYEDKNVINSLPIILYESIGENRKAKRLMNCASDMEIGIKNNQRHLIKAKFCGDRYCSICQYIKTRKRFRNYRYVLLKILKDRPNIDFIHLTLTVPNEHYLDVYSAKHKMFQAWDRLCKTFTRHKNRDSGSFRHIFGGVKTVELVVEKPYRKKKFYRDDDTYFYAKKSKKNDMSSDRFQKVVDGEYLNLHIHTVLAVDKQYFDNMVSTEDWSKIWYNELTKVGYKLDIPPIVYANRVYYKNTDKSKFISGEELRTKSLEKAVFEAVKYTLKPIDLKPYLNNNIVFSTISKLFNRNNLWSDFGIIRDYRSKYSIDDGSKANDIYKFDKQEQYESYESWKRFYNLYELISTD